MLRVLSATSSYPMRWTLAGVLPKDSIGSDENFRHRGDVPSADLPAGLH